MVIHKTPVLLDRGLQARNAVNLMKIAANFNSTIVLIKNGVTSGLDLLEIMKLAIKEGEQVTILAEGDDELEVARTLEEYLTLADAD